MAVSIELTPLDACAGSQTLKLHNGHRQDPVNPLREDSRTVPYIAVRERIALLVYLFAEVIIKSARVGF